MKNLRIVYLDSSCLYNTKIIEYLKKQKVIICISELTLLEIKNHELYDNDFNRKMVQKVIDNAVILKMNGIILKMAKDYIKGGIFAKNEYNYALHFAIAKYYCCSEMLFGPNIYGKWGLRPI